MCVSVHVHVHVHVSIDMSLCFFKSFTIHFGMHIHGRKKKLLQLNLLYLSHGVRCSVLRCSFVFMSNRWSFSLFQHYFETKCTPTLTWYAITFNTLFSFLFFFFSFLFGCIDVHMISTKCVHVIWLRSLFVCAVLYYMCQIASSPFHSYVWIGIVHTCIQHKGGHILSTLIAHAST